MGYSAAETAKKHEQLLDESIRLFRQRGFRGVSVNELMKAAGLTHGPFYNHFASKEALMEESVDRDLKRAIEELDALDSTRESKTRYVEHYLRPEHLEDFAGGCTVAALSSELRQETTLRSLFTLRIKEVIEKLSKGLPWRSKRSARGDAIHMYASLVGAIILARAVDDDAFAREILNEVKERTL